MSNFHVGQKVVCIEDEWPSCVPSPITKGSVYTVAQILPPDLTESFDGWNVRSSIHLVEVKNNVAVVDMFNPARFRPAIIRKTDISQLKAMLNYRPKVVVVS